MLLNYLFILFNMYRTIQFLFHIGYVFIVYLFLEIVPFHLNVLICLKFSFIILRAAESVFITRILFLMLEMCSLLSLSVFSDIYQFFKSLKKPSTLYHFFLCLFLISLIFFPLILITSFLLFALVLFSFAVSWGGCLGYWLRIFFSLY